LKLFTRWYELHHECPLPASVEAIVAYLSWLAITPAPRTRRPRRVSTMQRALVSISLAHKAAGFEDPPVSNVAVHELMKGFRLAV
jgi:hypothetical protein